MSNRGALSLLQNYGNDSSDEDTPNYRVSTKRMLHEDDSKNAKRLAKLPLPNLDLTMQDNGHEDNPELHDGRLRSFPHERGNWATFTYVPIECGEGLDKMIDSIIELCRGYEMKRNESLHISLTKTVVLQHHWIDSFVQTIKHNLIYTSKFMVMFKDSLKVYNNEEKTRTFVGIPIRTGYDSLVKLVDCLDRSLQEFKLPTFYKDKSFHISIAWCVGDCKDELNKLLPIMNEKIQESMCEYSQENWYVYVDHILCKIGNKQFKLNLL